MKGDLSMSVADLKGIIKAANKPNKHRPGAKIKLTGSKKELQERLKAAGRWRANVPPKIPKTYKGKKVVKGKVYKPKKKVAPKKAAPKSKVDKDLLQVAMGIMANVGKEKHAERTAKELKLQPFSTAQLKTIYRKFIKETKDSRVTIKKGTRRDSIIHWITTNNIPDRFYPKKAAKATKYTYYMEGWNLNEGADEDEDKEEDYFTFDGEGVYWKLVKWGESGIEKYEAKASPEQMKHWKDMWGDMLETSARVWRETAKTELHLWDEPF
jgi:hypothetical protein